MRVNVGSIVGSWEIWPQLSQHANLLNRIPSLSERLDQKIQDWNIQTSRLLAREFPLHQHEQAFEKWCDFFDQGKGTDAILKNAVGDYLKLCRAVGQPENENHWQPLYKPRVARQAEMANALQASFVSEQQLTRQWRKVLDKARAEWELQTIRDRRAALIAQLNDLLELFQELADAIEIFGFGSGVLFDLSDGALSPEDIDQFKRWARYLSEDEGMRNLCDVLGKLRETELSERIERSRTMLDFATFQPNLDSREEIVGLRIGHDLEHVVPSELALLADPETEILFNLKLVEARLLCFDMQGIQASRETCEVEMETSIFEAEKLGPMIICLDTSASMAGMPETLAKAVALFLATKAREQKRECYLINFSTNIATYNLGDGLGLSTLMNFLRQSFHGGTDVAPALNHALNQMESKEYAKADVLVISDFVMANCPEATLCQVRERKALGNRFHSLVLSSDVMAAPLNGLFDQEWVFNPSTSEMRELVAFKRNMSIARST